MFHEHGLSIDYGRVLEVSEQLRNAVVSRYIERSSFEPWMKLITISHQPQQLHHSMTSACTSSNTQHRTIIVECGKPIQIWKNTVKTVPRRPDSYVNIRPAFSPKKNTLPSKGHEYQWLGNSNSDKMMMTRLTLHGQPFIQLKRGFDVQVRVISLRLIQYEWLGILLHISIYAVADQIQWQWSDQYGDDKCVIMFDGLYWEMTAFRSLLD